MKINLINGISAWYSLAALLLCSIVLGSISCSPEVIIPDPPSNSSVDKLLFCYRENDQEWGYCSRQMTGGMGSDLYCDGSGDNFSGYTEMAGIEVANRLFVLGHNKGGTSYNKDWFIREVHASGEWAGETDGGSWAHNYETLFGFNVGSKGFIFGQDSYGDHRWFVQEVTADGKLAGSESDSGTWNNYYASATPIYLSGKTFIFFQTDNSDNYCFISSVSEDGKLTDVCDDRWEYFWETITSVKIGGYTYLVGIRNRHTMSDLGEWFIQRINYDGTFGAETDRGTWADFYPYAIAYTYNDRAYLFGYTDQASSGGHWFTQEITSGGKMGSETSSGNMGYYYKFFQVFTQYGPDSFRYRIGWDWAPTAASPSRGWSPLFSNPWSGATKLGGGVALGHIDQDGAGHYEAVFSGIQDIAGTDRHYYKIAWNLEPVNNGYPTGFGKTFYGPECGGNQAGGGAEIADIDGNGISDLVLMSVDDPEGANAFWYYIGWNFTWTGQVTTWSNKFQVDGLGYNNAGGGLAMGDLDGNGRPEMVLVAIDDPTGTNKFWYKLGRNLDSTGKAASWSTMLTTPYNLGDVSGGGGAALADLNGNGKPDLVLVNIDSPQGANPFWGEIGWDIDINGVAASWSTFTAPAMGDITSGGGTAIGDIDKNGILDLLLMSVDNPWGKD